jgi:hypothetical protein
VPRTNRAELAIHGRDIRGLARELTTLTADIERLRVGLLDVFDRFLSAPETSRLTAHSEKRAAIHGCRSSAARTGSAACTVPLGVTQNGTECSAPS